MNRDYARALFTQQQAMIISKEMIARKESPYDKLGMFQRDGLQDAQPFFWNAETTSAVKTAATSIPEDTKLSQWNLPMRAAWWYFETPMLDAWTLHTKSGKRVCAPIRALSVFWSGNMFNIMPWSDSVVAPGEIFACGILQWPEGKSVGEMADTPGQTTIFRGEVAEDLEPAHSQEPTFVLAALAWMEQEVLTDEPAGVHRARRREYARVTGGPANDVRIVNLRRSNRHENGATTDESTTIYSVRWVVDGHWRNQPCGVARADRRLTWISPYIKGPDTMPLKPAKPKLYAVVR